MKIFPLNSLFINFEGQRKDRQKVEQLKKNNPYGLNPINQRQISESIENIASRGGK